MRQTFGNLSRLVKGLGRAAVRAKQAGMHLFLTERCLAPAEIGHRLGTVRIGFQCP